MCCKPVFDEELPKLRAERDALQEQLRHADLEIIALNKDLDVAEAEVVRLKAALRNSNYWLTYMATWHGAAHEKDCPEDDTCNCQHKDFNDSVNKAINEGVAALSVAAQPPNLE